MDLRKLGTRNAATVSPRSTILDAAKIMREQHVGDVVVVGERNGKNAPIGILTDRDIVVSTVAFNLQPDGICVEDVMGPALAKAQTSDSLLHVLNLMKEHGVRRVPLVNSNDELTGIISMDDIVNFLGMELSDIAKISEVQRNIETQRRKNLA
ncbi:CBS domain-containing protein [bacterium]|nr:CBS domain-containing protein [bacterium]